MPKKYEIVYNVDKTVCLCIHSKKLKLVRKPTLSLGGNVLTYVSSMTYLGYTVTEDFCDDADIKKHTRYLYVRCNMLLSKFHMCTPEVKIRLFRTFCSVFYCSHLWSNYSKAVYNKFRVAYNNCFRRFMGYSRTCSASQMFLYNNLHHFNVIRRGAIYSFLCRAETICNILAKNAICINVFYGSSFYKEMVGILFLDR